MAVGHLRPAQPADEVDPADQPEVGDLLCRARRWRPASADDDVEVAIGFGRSRRRRRSGGRTPSSAPSGRGRRHRPAPPGRRPGGQRAAGRRPSPWSRSTPFGMTRPRPGPRSKRASASERVNAEQAVTAAAWRSPWRSEARRTRECSKMSASSMSVSPCRVTTRGMPGRSRQPCGVGPVRTEALHMKDVGPEGGDRPPQGCRGCEADGGRPGHGRPVGGRKWHGQSAHDQPVEDFGRFGARSSPVCRSTPRPRPRQRSD